MAGSGDSRSTDWSLSSWQFQIDVAAYQEREARAGELVTRAQQLIPEKLMSVDGLKILKAALAEAKDRFITGGTDDAILTLGISIAVNTVQASGRIPDDKYITKNNYLVYLHDLLIGKGYTNKNSLKKHLIHVLFEMSDATEDEKKEFKTLTNIDYEKIAAIVDGICQKLKELNCTSLLEDRIASQIIRNLFERKEKLSLVEKVLAEGRKKYEEQSSLAFASAYFRSPSKALMNEETCLEGLFHLLNGTGNWTNTSLKGFTLKALVEATCANVHDDKILFMGSYQAETLNFGRLLEKLNSEYVKAKIKREERKEVGEEKELKEATKDEKQYIRHEM